MGASLCLSTAKDRLVALLNSCLYHSLITNFLDLRSIISLAQCAPYWQQALYDTIVARSFWRCPVSVCMEQPIQVTKTIYQPEKDSQILWSPRCHTIHIFSFWTFTPHSLPSTLKHLKITAQYPGRGATQTHAFLTTLPTNLKSLVINNLGANVLFPQNMLPPNLKRLECGQWTISPKWLPSTLEVLKGINMGKSSLLRPLVHLHTLEFNNDVNQNNPTRKKPIQLPESLTHLKVGECFDGSLERTFSLPANLHTLDLGSCFSFFVCKSSFNDNLQVLKIRSKFFTQPLQKGVLPSKLQVLWLGSHCDIGPDVLPPCLKELAFQGTLAAAVVSAYHLHLPDGLARLCLGTCDTTLTKEGFALHGCCSQLRRLSLCDGILFPEHTVQDCAWLQTLVMPPNFNQRIQPGVLPGSLTVLQLGHWYNQAFVQSALPSSLKALNLHHSRYFQAPLTNDVLPPNLQCVSLSIGYFHHSLYDLNQMEFVAFYRETNGQNVFFKTKQLSRIDIYIFCQQLSHFNDMHSYYRIATRSTPLFTDKNTDPWHVDFLYHQE